MRIALFVSVTLALAACGEKATKDSQNSRSSPEDLQRASKEAEVEPSPSVTPGASALAFLGPEELVEPALISQPLTSDKVAAAIADIASFYLNFPTPAQGDASGPFSALTFTATKTEAQLTGSAQPGVSQNEGSVVTVMKGRLYVKITCAGADLSSLAGKGLASFDFTLCEGATETALLVNSDVNYSVAAGELVYTMRSVQALMTTKAEPCRAQRVGTLWRFGECVDLDKTLILGGTLGKATIAPYLSSFRSLTYNQLTAQSLRDLYYTSGGMAISLDGWKGAIAYKGAATAPEWTLGRDSDTLRGTFGGTAPVTEPPIISGLVRSVSDAGLVIGWAFDGAKPDAALSVQLTGPDAVPPQTIAEVAANGDGDDDQKPGNHSFSFQLPASLCDGKSHVLSGWVKNAAAANGLTRLTGSPMTYTCYAGTTAGKQYFTATVLPAHTQTCGPCHPGVTYANMFPKLLSPPKYKGGTAATNLIVTKGSGGQGHTGGNRCNGVNMGTCALIQTWWGLEFN